MTMLRYGRTKNALNELDIRSLTVAALTVAARELIFGRLANYDARFTSLACRRQRVGVSPVACLKRLVKWL